MPTDDMAGYMARVLVREGAWVIEPERRDGGFVERLLQGIRTVPARIHQPTGRNPYRFAERGAEGKWFFIWVEDK